MSIIAADKKNAPIGLSVDRFLTGIFDPLDPVATFKSYVAMLEQGMPCDEEIALLFPIELWLAYFSQDTDLDTKLTLAFAGWIFLLGVLPYDGLPAIWEFPSPQELAPLERLLPARKRCAAHEPDQGGPLWLIDAAFRVVVSHRYDRGGVTLAAHDNACAYLNRQAAGTQAAVVRVGDEAGTVRALSPTNGLVFLDRGWFIAPRAALGSSVIGSPVCPGDPCSLIK